MFPLDDSCNLVFTAAGSYTLTASSAGLTSATSSAFTVASAAPPTLLSITPNFGLIGHSLQVTITGQATYFQQGVTQANFGPGLSVGSGLTGQFGTVTVMSPTTAMAEVNIPANVILGPRAVTVKTGSETATLVNGFTVIGPPPCHP